MLGGGSAFGVLAFLVAAVIFVIDRVVADGAADP